MNNELLNKMSKDNLEEFAYLIGTEIQNLCPGKLIAVGIDKIQGGRTLGIYYGRKHYILPGSLFHNHFDEKKNNYPMLIEAIVRKVMAHIASSEPDHSSKFLSKLKN